MAEIVKRALKGLRAATAHLIVANTDTAYSVGERLQLPAIQRLTKDPQSDAFEIRADDDIYDAGEDFKSENLQAVYAEMSNELLAKLTGGTYDGADGIYAASINDIAPEVAFGYACLYKGGYRLFRHPVVKLMSVKVDHETKGEGGTIAPYTLNFMGTPRKIDGRYRLQKDIGLDDGFGWINTIESLPIVIPSVTYTLGQNGTQGDTKTTEITITFSESVIGLDKDTHLTITAPGATIGVLGGSGKNWTLAVSDVASDSTVKIEIADFGEYTFGTDNDTIDVYTGS